MPIYFMAGRKSAYVFFLTAVVLSLSQKIAAQQTGDDFKKRLKESLKSNPFDLKLELKHHSLKIEQYKSDVLKVSPDTKLPTKYDNLLSIPLPPEPNIEMTVTNRKAGPLIDKVEYAKMKIPPDAVPWLLHSKIISPIGPGFSVGVGDLDPVRAIQAYKRAKRQKKIDRIKKAFGQ